MGIGYKIYFFSVFPRRREEALGPERGGEEGRGQGRGGADEGGVGAESGYGRDMDRDGSMTGRSQSRG